MLGRVLNTHQQWLCRRLADLGYVVTRQVAVADTGHDIEQAVARSAGARRPRHHHRRAGPDFRRHHARPDRAAARQKAARGRGDRSRTSNSSLRRANAPCPPAPACRRWCRRARSCWRIRTAPRRAGDEGGSGGWKSKSANSVFAPTSALNRRKWLIMLPGPPRELRPMFNDIGRAAAAPRVAARRRVCLSHAAHRRHRRIAGRRKKLTGRCETLVGARTGPRLLRATSAQVDVRLAARGPQAAQLVREAEAVVRGQLGAHIFGVGRRNPGSRHRPTADRAEANPRPGGILHRRLHRASPDECARRLGGLAGRAGDLQQ